MKIELSISDEALAVDLARTIQHISDLPVDHLIAGWDNTQDGDGFTFDVRDVSGSGVRYNDYHAENWTGVKAYAVKLADEGDLD